MGATGMTSRAATVRPINDGISNTILLAEREGSYSDQGGSKATAEFGETDVGGTPAEHSVWYRYVAPADGRLVVDIIDDSGLRAELRRPGNPATTIPLQTLVDGTSNTIASGEERLSGDFSKGEAAYLVVDSTQPFDFSWRFIEVPNDTYRDAESLTGAEGTVIRYDTGARLGSHEKSLGYGGAATWFEWTAGSSGLHHVDLVGSRQRNSANYGPFWLYVYEASSAGIPETLLGSANGSSLDNSTRVSFTAAAGKVYYFACHGDLAPADNEIWLSWYPDGGEGVFAWAQPQYRASEADGAVQVRVHHLRGWGPCSADLLGVAGGSAAPATAGSDYPSAPVSLPFVDQDRSQQAFFPITPDGVPEPAESFGLSLTNRTGGVGLLDGTSNTILIGEELATGACGFPQAEVHVREGQTAWLEVRRLRAGTAQMALPWRIARTGTASPLEDLQVISGTAYLGPNETSTFIQIPILEDGDFEGGESFTVSLSDAPQAGAIVDGSSNTLLVVEDNDYFVPLAGKYCGLIDTGGWGALIKCTITGLGSASGTVDYQGARYSFRGAFDASGQLVAAFSRNNRASLGLRLQFAQGWAACTASLRDPEGEWADGVVRRLPYDRRKSPAPQAGVYTIWCQGQGAGGVSVPGAFTSTVLGDGSVRFVGRLADNTVTSFSGAIGQADPDGGGAGECVFMASLYGKGGNLYGTLDFGLGPQQPGSDTWLGWLKPWRARDTYYPALPFQACLSAPVRFTPPTGGDRVTDGLTASFGDGSVRFINGGTPLDGTSNTLLVSEQNRVTFPSGNPHNCSITINPKTGWFSGRIAPSFAPATPFYGVFLQGGYDVGRGFSLGGRQSGEVIIEDF